jgi:hypothetical protein
LGNVASDLALQCGQVSELFDVLLAPDLVLGLRVYQRKEQRQVRTPLH